MRTRIPWSFPEGLKVLLARIGEDLRADRLDPEDLRSALVWIGALPPEAIAQAAAGIADSARLWAEMQPDRWYIPPALGRRSDAGRLRETPDLECLFLFHRGGRLREAALRKVVDAPATGFFLVAIVYRLNDWVPQVRAAARACADRVLPRTDPDIVAQALVFLLRRTPAWQRWGENRAVLDAALARPEVAGRLAATLRTARSGPYGRLLRHAGAWPALDGHLAGLARDAVLPAVRSGALRMLIEGQATWPVGFERQWVDKRYGISRRVPVLATRPIAAPEPVAALIAAGARDRSAAVRRVAADGLVRHRRGIAEVDALVETLTRDRNPSVRDRAAFILKERAASHDP